MYYSLFIGECGVLVGGKRRDGEAGRAESETVCREAA